MRILGRLLCITLVVTLVLTTSALGQYKPSAQAKVAHFHLTGAITEQPGTPNPFVLFSGQEPTSFKDLLDRFKKARGDDSVKGVVLTFENLALGMAQIQELTQAIRDVRAADKDVYVHADQMGLPHYCLASAASHLSLVPTGDLWITGLQAEAPYLKGLLDKLSIEADWLQCGDYKAAAEPLTREGPTPEAEENMNWLLDGIYDAIVGMIADARQMSPEKVKAAIDDGPYSAERALKAGLIDSVQHRQDFVKDLKQRYAEAKFVKDYGEDEGPEIPEDFFGAFSFFMNMIQGGSEKKHGPGVAIVYVEGPIMTGSGQSDSPFGGASGAFSTPIRKALDKAAKDDMVKAVVLRVDSPGGSALASEIILDATKRIAAKKPLIVSMGNVAGSGGYYVACAANTIFADEATITASIGVVGGKLVTTGGWSRLGVNWHEYKRGEMAGLMSTSHRFNEQERAKITGYMNEVYEIFKGHVVAIRGDKLAKPIDQLAGGRVFTGKQALELGLVDKLGGLNDAVRFAAAEAKLSDYEIRVIPEPKDPLEMLLEMFGGGPEDEDEFASTPPTRARLFRPDTPLMQAVLPMLQRLDPLRVEAMLNTLHRLELIHLEGVITMMPSEIVIH